LLSSTLEEHLFGGLAQDPFLVFGAEKVEAILDEVDRGGVSVAFLNLERAISGPHETLGPEGVALLYVSDRILERVKPTTVGWMSVENWQDHLNYDLTYRDGALRYECGSLNTAGVYGLGAAIDLFLDVGAAVVEEYLLSLSDALAAGLEAKGYRLLGSRRRGETSGIVTCSHDRHTPKELYHRLSAQRIITAPRAGRLRMSPHFYNTREELEALIEALPE
jgi:selenocysteine lyase/cysteine desulfurase